MTTTIISPNVRRIAKTHRSKSLVTPHRIDGWVIQESLEPFPEKENKLVSIKQEQQVVSNESKVQQWNVSLKTIYEQFSFNILFFFNSD